MALACHPCRWHGVREAQRARAHGLHDAFAEVMTPRTLLDCLDVNDPAAVWKSQVVKQRSSRYFVCDGTIDTILGVVFAEDLLAQVAADQPLNLRDVLREPLNVPGMLPALSLLEQMRSSHRHVAVALDEYVGVEGAVLLDTLIDTLVGENPAVEGIDVRAAESANRTLTVARSSLLKDIEAEADLPEIPSTFRRCVRTLGGLIMNLLERVPRERESVEWKGVHFEVADMQGRSTSRVTIRKMPICPVAHPRTDQTSPY